MPTRLFSVPWANLAQGVQKLRAGPCGGLPHGERTGVEREASLGTGKISRLFA